MDPSKITLERAATFVADTHAENERLFAEWWSSEHAPTISNERHLHIVGVNAARRLAEAAFYAGMLAGLRRFP